MKPGLLHYSGILILGLATAVLASSKSGAAGDAAKGKETFEQCAVCHNVDTMDKKMGPSLKGLFKREKLANGNKVTEESVRKQINDGGNGMPAYQDMLSDDEKNDLIAYLKTI
jgi:cytochrome c